MKALMITDAATEIPALAFRLDEPSRSEWGRHVVARAGFGKTADDHATYLALVDLNNSEMHTDPYDWSNNTLRAAHLMLGKAACFDSLPDEDAVLDVEQYRLAMFS